MNNAPQRLLLEQEILNGEIKKVLFLHITDRWYLGDLLRHASWIDAVAEISAEVTLVTNRNYFPLFIHDPSVTSCVAAEDRHMLNMSDYDLVIVPSSIPVEAYDTNIRRGLYTDNAEITYARYGAVMAKFKKSDLNYFSLAQHQAHQTFFAPGGTYTMHLTMPERQKGADMVRALFPQDPDAPLLVYNPSASNAFTRQTSIAKEVDNTLAVDNAQRLLQQVLEAFPRYNILIAAAVREGDVQNYEIMQSLVTRCASRRVRSLTEVADIQEGISFRLFASVLKAPQTVSLFGNDTGTNAHFAALLDVPAIAIVRSADNTMIENWQQPDVFQMGSFRWRNTALCTSVFGMSWESERQDFSQFIHAMGYHITANQKHWDTLFTQNISSQAHAICTHLERSSLSIQESVQLFNDLRLIAQSFRDQLARSFYFSLEDELTYLETMKDKGQRYMRTISALRDSEEHLPDGVANQCVINLLRDTNLHKLMQLVSKQSMGPRTELSVVSLFRKTRAHCILQPDELAMLGFDSVEVFAQWMHELTDPLLRKVVHTYPRDDRSRIVGPWQHRVFVDENKECVVKDMDVNPESVYFTEEWTLQSIQTALDCAGGCIPSQSLTVEREDSYTHVARKVKPFFGGAFVNHDAKFSSWLTNNKKKYIDEISLPIGWVTEFFELFVRFVQQGIYNVDVRLIDTALDEYGVYVAVDVGALKDAGVLYEEHPNLIKDIFHLGINQLLINRRLVSKFKNGAELVTFYEKELERLIGIDIKDLPLMWEWGDHDDPSLRPFADALRSFVYKFASSSSCRPVYPLWSKACEDVVYTALKERLQNRIEAQ